ncbi:MAG: sodium-dependent transporter [Rhodothermales bacterium]|nr:sodium-dependent transporter [Rhodothermales bacterium]
MTTPRRPSGARHPGRAPASRETFSSRFGLLVTMIGVAVGLGNVWRFPYMAGEFGGAPFVLFYVLMAALVGVPALMAEWTLGRATRRGPVGAFVVAGVPGGRLIGWCFFAVVLAATAYYTNAVGWVLFHAAAEVAGVVGLDIDPSRVLPPAEGFDAGSFARQLASTGVVIAACAAVLLKGLRRGIEKISGIVLPILLVILCVLIVRGLTLDGAAAGVEWYVLKFDASALSGSVMLAALGQAVFSLSLGGTYMVVYGSYLREDEPLLSGAAWTAAGDITAGLLAGLAIFPAVFALGLEPAAGPGLLFSTLPAVFDGIPAGAVFGLLFFTGLAGAAWLSDIAAFEVLIAGLTDNTGLSRRQAVIGCAATVFVLAIPSMINMRIFVPWDLAFGSGMQTIGALIAALTVGWALGRGRALRQAGASALLLFWVRFVVPSAILLVGIWWMLTDVLGVVVL